MSTFQAIDLGQINSNGSLAITANLSSGNLAITQNITTGNLVVTQNISGGNLSITTNLTAANATVNGVSFIPTWTNITVNTAYTPLTSLNQLSYWTDPFGIVHLRGAIEANTGNVNLTSFTSGTNVANGLPLPAGAAEYGF